MKSSIITSRLFVWLLMLLPFIYLAGIWESLPDTVPTHFNAQGEPDGWGSKATLIWLPMVLIFPTYILLELVPMIDPKNKLGAMGKKYEHLKMIVLALLSALSVVIIYSARQGQLGMNPGFLFALFGLFFALIGNYFPAIRHNYFVGIRTPWTLESETVWKRTHRMAGHWWVVGGILIVIASLLLDKQWVFPVFISITLVITLVPIVYSYLEFKKLS